MREVDLEVSPPARGGCLGQRLGVACLLTAISLLPGFSCAARSIRNENYRSPPTRIDFAAAFARIEDGMDREEVLEILGRPDDIVTERDPTPYGELFCGMGTRRQSEIWCYGADGHLGYPTLGRLQLDGRGKVEYRHFYSRSFEEVRLPSPFLLPEHELRPLLALLDESAGRGSIPLDVIRAVNTLQALGQEKATAVLEEYARVGGPWKSRHDDEGLICVVRLLFDVPEPPGYMKIPALGAASPPPPMDLRISPRFPFTLIDDIPLFVTAGYSGSGYPETFDIHLKMLSKTCRFRAGPLVPTDRPWEVLEKLRASREWLFGRTYDSFYDPRSLSPQDFQRSDEEGQESIIRQILRLLDPVYRPGEEDWSHLWSRLKEWPEIVENLSRLRIHWDRTRLTYVLADGSTLPPRKRFPDRRIVWRPKILEAYQGVLYLERRNEKSVCIGFEISSDDKSHGINPERPFPLTFRFLNPDEPGQAIHAWSTTISPAGGSTIWMGIGNSESFLLEEGKKVRVELATGNQKILGPEVVP
jgi:hypothetical protein